MYRTLLVGTDGSATANEAVEVALAVAAPLGAHVHLLSVDVTGDDSAARAALAGPAARAAELGVACSTHVAAGTNPGRVIVEKAGEVGADLVVVGDHGMHGVNRLLSGSVPNHVAHNAPCSVLLVDSTRRVGTTG